MQNKNGTQMHELSCVYNRTQIKCTVAAVFIINVKEK